MRRAFSNVVGTVALSVFFGVAAPSVAQSGDLENFKNSIKKKLKKNLKKPDSLIAPLSPKKQVEILKKKKKRAEKFQKSVSKALKGAGQKAIDLHKKAIKEKFNAGKDAERTLRTGEAHGDVAKTLTKAEKDVLRTWDKFVEDTARETGNSLKEMEKLVSAIGHYIEDEFHSGKKIMSDADKKFREGKIVDALWDTHADVIKERSKNSAAAVMHSKYLNAVASTVARVKGGPAGAAAYAAWLTYEQTGDLEASLKAGLITGATAYASGKAGEIPSDVKRVIVSGAIGGAAVFANGGDKQEILDGVLKSGGVVVLQIGYREYTGKEFDPRSSKGEALCKGSPGDDCAPSDAAYDKDGNLDMRKLTDEEARRPQVGESAKKGGSSFTAENSKFMTNASRIPGMNAMAYMHDMVATDIFGYGASKTLLYDVVNKGTIPHAMVFAYTAGGAPVYTFIQDIGVKKYRKNIMKKNKKSPKVLYGRDGGPRQQLWDEPN